MIWDHGEFIEYEGVGCIFGGEACEEELRGWVLEGVYFGRFRAWWRVLFEILGLHSKGRAIAELVLDICVRDLVSGIGGDSEIQDILGFLLW